MYICYFSKLIQSSNVYKMAKQKKEYNPKRRKKYNMAEKSRLKLAFVVVMMLLVVSNFGKIPRSQIVTSVFYLS